MPSSLRHALEERVLVLDGAMGTSLLSQEDPQDSLPGAKTCLDLLTLTHPERVERVHEGFLEVGCDLIETNTFLSSPLALAEYGLAERAVELNRAAARLARRAADHHATPEKPRWVVGAIGPGTRLPSLGQVDVPTLRESFRVQVRSLLEEGVDALLLETCQDPLQIRAALDAALAVRDELGVDCAMLVSVTVEITGRLLSGATLIEVVDDLRDAPIDLLGLNCATGPREMNAPLRELARRSPHRVGVYPNAGLPLMVNGRAEYALTPAELALWLTRFVEEDGASVVGGCCGTTPEHLRAVVASIGRRVAPDHPGGDGRSQAARRSSATRAVDRPRAPRIGPHVIESLPLRNVLPYVNEEGLFRFRWGYQRRGRTVKEHDAWIEQEIRPRYHQLLKDCVRSKLFQPRATLGFWRARAEGDALALLDPSGERLLRLDLPRQEGRSGLCLTDFFSDGEDELALAAVTLGGEASDAVRKHFDAGDLEAKRELDGLAAELLAGLEETVHAQLRAEWGISHEDARETPQLLAGGYRGARFDFGTPPLPTDGLAPVLEVLEARRIGIELAEEDGSRFTPPLSAVFLVAHHPDARFFTV